MVNEFGLPQTPNHHITTNTLKHLSSIFNLTSLTQMSDITLNFGSVKITISTDTGAEPQTSVFGAPPSKNSFSFGIKPQEEDQLAAQASFFGAPPSKNSSSFGIKSREEKEEDRLAAQASLLGAPPSSKNSFPFGQLKQRMEDRLAAQASVFGAQASVFGAPSTPKKVLTPSFCPPAPVKKSSSSSRFAEQPRAARRLFDDNDNDKPECDVDTNDLESMCNFLKNNKVALKQKRRRRFVLNSQRCNMHYRRNTNKYNKGDRCVKQAQKDGKCTAHYYYLR